MQVVANLMVYIVFLLTSSNLFGGTPVRQKHILCFLLSSYVAFCYQAPEGSSINACTRLMVQTYGVACRRLGIFVLIMSVLSTAIFLLGGPDSRRDEPDTTVVSAASPVAATRTAVSGRQKWLKEPYFHLTTLVYIFSQSVLIMTRVLPLSVTLFSVWCTCTNALAVHVMLHRCMFHCFWWAR